MHNENALERFLDDATRLVAQVWEQDPTRRKLTDADLDTINDALAILAKNLLTNK